MQLQPLRQSNQISKESLYSWQPLMIRWLPFLENMGKFDPNNLQMLGLKLLTDPRWANIAESNLEEILTDHAWCEQKAATNAISLITQNPEHQDLVHELTAIAIEEMHHFQQVIDIIKQRGYTLGRERKDDYVNQLMKFMKKDGSRNTAFIDHLLFASTIEAR